MYEHNVECRALEVIGQEWSGEVVSLFQKSLGAWAGSLELPRALGPAVPGNERSVPGTLTVTVFTVYGRLSHLGRACDSVERSVVREF